ncbi:MAG TPA: HAMP domain-containing sensor histidine kinase [Sphingomicrobium sp.]|nr:HAMP domain-containing sensor histidine kinase [Sphingomicrobium sp.]
MAFDRQFDVGLIWRLALILALGALTLLAFLEGSGAATRILLVAALVGAVADLWAHLRRTNLAVARFVEAVRFEDFSQRFTLGRGTGFEALGKALDNAIVELGAKRSEAAEEARFLSAVVDDSPVALLTIDEDGRVTLLNKAARRQFVDQHGIRIADFAPYGAEFVAALGLPPSGRRLTQFIKDGVAQRVMIETARIERLGSNLRIVSMLPVQNVLGAAEMAAQSGLVRVLTHEIMNSLTPVTSLVRSAADILASAEKDPKALAEARQAVEIAATRAEGMHRFVETYRSFARLPEIRRRRFAAEPWAAEIGRLCTADPVTSGIALDMEIPAEFSLDADPDLMAQVCLNLIRNAATAARNHAAEPKVGLTVQPSGDGDGARIEIYDNGPGIDPKRREDIFLPFYTTRPDGTGVGLSFARQIVVAHGGTISAGVSPIGGASIIAVI